MSGLNKLKERKPDGGLAEWIEVYEAMGGKDDGEMLCLLIELRRHRLNGNQLEAAKQRAERIDAMLSEAIEALKAAEARIAEIEEQKAQWVAWAKEGCAIADDLKAELARRNREGLYE